jgi:HAD superfamily hydrolase (TIGR01549 family)
MAFSLLVFDCDGVILESVDVKTKAFKRIGDDFGPELSDRLVMYHQMHGGVSRFKKFAWLYQEALGRPTTPEEDEALNKRFTRYALDEVMRCPLVPGAQKVLDRWKGVVPMYVASGAPRDELEFILRERGLDGYFDGIRGYPPGKSALLQSIVQRAGTDPSQTVMVGDASTDMLAAEAVGTLFYGRGKFFAGSGYPWHDDLTRLNEYLESL